MFMLKAIKKVLGPKGTILIPTYSYSFGKLNKKKLPLFNVKKTPSKIGSFGNFFLKQKGVVRSEDPMTSVAGLGKNVKKILENISPTSYGKDCVFERILKIKNSKCCSIGLGPNWIPFIHHCDWLNQAPFRYDKYFEGTIVNGKVKKRIVWHYPVRYLRKETLANGHKIGKLATKSKIFKYYKLGRSRIYAANYKKYFHFTMKLIKKTPWMTVDGPKFKVNKVS
jgi:aminoglycoside N3'-acetyltransferase